jgi:hypothetical protein
MLMVVYKNASLAFEDLNNNCNIYVAAATTAWARIKLYEHLNVVGVRVIYCDTDSVIYICGGCGSLQLVKKANLKTGDFLGDMTSELKTGDHICSFCSAGAKCYAYLTLFGERVVKTKGVTLHVTNAEAFTFDNMEKVIQAFQQKINPKDPKEKPASLLLTKNDHLSRKRTRDEAMQTHALQNDHSAVGGPTYISTFTPHQIKRTNDFHIYSDPLQKMWTVNYDKRVIQPDYDTLPYGY